MSLEPTVASRPSLRLRADVPTPPTDWLSIAARPTVLTIALAFVILGGASLELGPDDARLGLASSELLGPFGRVFGYWDPSLWPGSVILGRIWAYFEETGPSPGVVRWPSAIAGAFIGILLARRARLTVGPRAGVLVALAWCGSIAMMDRSAALGLDLIAGLGTIAALDRLLTKGAGWVVGVWASLAFLAAGWPPLAVIALATVVLGRSGATWSWSMTIPVVATVAGWSAWALSTAPAEAWASALALPITQSSAWGLVLGVIGLGLPWAPFILLAKNRSIRDGWSIEARPLVLGWLKVAGASLIVGTVVPGLASAATMPALAGLAVVVACCWDRVWTSSGDLPQSVNRWAIGLSMAIAGLWFAIALGFGGYVGFAVAYYRSTLICVGILSLAGFLLALHAARIGNARWALSGIIVVSIAIKLAHWGYYAPEWNYRNGAGPWGRAIGQWVPEKHPVYVLHSWPADLAFAIGRPVRQLPSPNNFDLLPDKNSKFVLLQDSEYAEYQSWGSGWPKLLKVAQFEDEMGQGHRYLMRTDAPLIVERPHRKHDPRE
jgi:hypothetical protein